MKNNTSNTTAKKATGKKLVSTIKKAAPKKSKHPLQWENSFMKEEKEWPVMKEEVWQTEPKPLQWFEAFTGKLLYALSENGFNGVIDVVNVDHCKKLFKAQEKGYRFRGLISRLNKVLDIDRQKKELKQIESLTPLPGAKGFTLKQNEVINILDDLDIASITKYEDLKNSEQEIFNALAKKYHEICTPLYNIIVSQATEAEKQEAYTKVKSLPTVKQIAEEAKSYAEETAEILHRYMDTRSEYNTVKCALHNLLFNGSENDAPNFQYLLEKIKNFLSLADVQSRFIAQNQNIEPAEMLNDLSKLIMFFEKMEQPEYDAELQAYAIFYNKHKFDYLDLKYLRSIYSKKLSVGEFIERLEKENTEN